MSLSPRFYRVAAIAITVVLIVLVAALTGISLLVSTSTGSQWLLGQLLQRMQTASSSLSIEQSMGNLLSGMDFQQLHYRDADMSLSIATLQARWNPLTFLSGEIRLDRVRVDGVSLHWSGAAQDTADPDVASSDPFAGVLPLPWTINLVRLAVADAHLSWEGGAYDFASLTLAAHLEDTQLEIRELQYLAAPLRVNGELALDLHGALPLHGALHWEYNDALVAGLEDAMGDLNLAGDLNTLVLQHQLTQPLQISSQGSIDLQLFGNTASAAQTFSLLHTLPAQTLGVTGLNTEELLLRLQSASLNTGGELSTLSVAGEARFSIEDTAGVEIAPPLSLHWDTAVRAASIELKAITVASDSGQLQAGGEVQWRDGLRVDLQIAVQENDVSAYRALLPEGLLIGPLKGEAQLHIEEDADSYQGSIRIASLSGELNGYPLFAEGGLSYAKGILLIDKLLASSGNTRLEVSGQWDEQVDLRWQLQAPDLATLSPLFSGSIEADGHIQGSPETPQITLSAAGKALDFGDISIASLAASGSYLNNSNLLELSLEGLLFGSGEGERIDSLRLTATGLPADHGLRVRLQSPLADADLRLSGALEIEEGPRWAGRLQEASLNSELGLWQLSSPVALTFSPESAQSERQCWRQDDSTLCLEAAWQDASSLSLNATLEDFSLAHFNAPATGSGQAQRAITLLPTLPVGSRVQGTLGASFSAQGNPSDLQALALDITVSAGDGQLQLDSAAAEADEGNDEDAQEQVFHWRAASTTGRRRNGEWELSSILDFYQPDLAASGMSVQGSANGQLRISADEQLDGQLNLAFQDLSWIEAFLPTLQNIEGQLRGLSIISGTLEAPRFGGTISLSDAAVDVPALGLSLQDIDATISSDDEQTVAVQGSVSSGTGSLRFLSEITSPLTAARRFEMSLSGQDFTLVNNEELQLTITPDLHIKGSADALDISGDVTLPRVAVQITSLPESAYDVSADTVVIGNTDSAQEVHNAAQADRGLLDSMALTAQLRIALGEEAHFQGFGLEAKLNGALEITQRATGAPLTYGELNVVEGNYQTYGRSLNIEHGKLLFFGSMENPALDIRAVRQADNIKVGVQMNGTLRNIRSQLFSTPTLPDGDIIAVMLTGRPLAEVGNQDSNALIGAITSLGIDQGQGLTNQVRNQLGLDTLAITSTGDTSNSSLTLGKYLTPKIFIRYGVGLFETESTLSVDYSISDRIKLEAKSGSSQSVDLKYTVER